MDKEDNLFEDQTNEDEDLLDISLDDLSADEIEEPAKEEPDEEVIELMDLVERGDAELLGIADDTDILAEEGISSEELDELQADDADAFSLLDSEQDDILNDSDISALDDDSGTFESVEESDLILEEDSGDESEIVAGQSDSSEPEPESLFDDTESERPSCDSGSSSDEAEEFDLDMEDFSDLDSVLDEAGLLDDETGDAATAEDDSEDALFDDLDIENDLEEDVLTPEDEILDEPDEEPEKTIVSSGENVSIEESLWDMDSQDEAGMEEPVSEDMQDQMAGDDGLPDISDSDPDETDDVPLDSESLEDIFADIEKEGDATGGESEYVEEQITDDEDRIEALDSALDEIDDIPLDGESLGELMSDAEFKDEIDTVDPQPEDMPEQYPEEDKAESFEDTSDEIIEEAFEAIESQDAFFSDEVEAGAQDEEEMLSDELSDIFTDDADVPVTSDEADMAEAEEDIFAEPAAEGISASDDLMPETDLPAPVSQQPLISDEKIEAIVRDVVGEAVERIAREVFTEVAEKVITEAIDSLKKSLETGSE